MIPTSGEESQRDFNMQAWEEMDDMINDYQEECRKELETQKN